MSATRPIPATADASKSWPRDTPRCHTRDQRSDSPSTRTVALAAPRFTDALNVCTCGSHASISGTSRATASMSSSVSRADPPRGPPIIVPPPA